VEAKDGIVGVAGNFNGLAEGGLEHPQGPLGHVHPTKDYSRIGWLRQAGLA